MFYTAVKKPTFPSFLKKEMWKTTAYVKVFSAPHTTPWASRLEGTRTWEKTQQDSWSQLAKGIFHTISHMANIKGK